VHMSVTRTLNSLSPAVTTLHLCQSCQRPCWAQSLSGVLLEMSTWKYPCIEGTSCVVRKLCSFQQSHFESATLHCNTAHAVVARTKVHTCHMGL
jgi:hypothetical protein